MKFTKLSLAAIVAMGIASSASAVENVKVDGHIKLWYQTTDTTKGNLSQNYQAEHDGLFKERGASGDLVAKLRATGDLTKKVGFGTTFYAVTTLGLENNTVSSEAIGTTSTDRIKVEKDGNGKVVSVNNDGLNGSDKMPMWLGEAYFTYKAGKTIAKIGRQELDTPLAFTETWNAAPNTFEAAVLLNQDIPNTTLVGAYVSRGNGTDDILGVKSDYGRSNDDTVVDGSFYSFGTNAFSGKDTGARAKGAWVLGAVTTAIPMTTAQAWLYNIQGAAQAYWLQADAKLPMNIGVGAQYAYLTAVGPAKRVISASNTNDYKTDAYAVQATYSIADVNLAAAYSSVSKGTLGVGNYATAGYDSKLYTASVLKNGSEPATNSVKVSANTKLAGFDLGASYGHYDVKENEGGYLFNRTAKQTYKSSEIDLSVGTKIDEINLAAYYVNVQDKNKDKQDIQAIRLIASINF